MVIETGEDLPGSGGRVSLLDVVRAVKAGWQDVVIVAAAGLLLGIIYLVVAKPVYTVKLVVGPAQDQNSSGLSGTFRQLSALTSLNLNQSGSGFSTALDILQSDAVAVRLVKDQKIMREIFKSEWDAQTGQFHPSFGILGSLARLPEAVLGRPSYVKPGPGRLETYLSKSITVTDFGDNNLKQLIYRTADPEFGKYLLTQIYRSADDEMKENTLRRAEKYIQYLEIRLGTVTVAEHRAALTQLLVDQERTRMTIDPSLPFVMQVITPSMASDYPTNPAIWPTLAVALSLGGVIGAILAFIFRRPVLWEVVLSRGRRR